METSLNETMMTKSIVRLTNLAEVLEVDLAVPISVVVLQDLQDVHLFHLKAQCSHRHLLVNNSSAQRHL